MRFATSGGLPAPVSLASIIAQLPGWTSACCDV
jgi:hypothetical protein